MCVYIYIDIWSHPPKIYPGRLHTIPCLLIHTCTLVISAEATVDIGKSIYIYMYIYIYIYIYMWMVSAPRPPLPPNGPWSRMPPLPLCSPCGVVVGF